MSVNLQLTRQMWQLLEPVHAVLYYAPEAFEEAASLGYDTESRWPSYFAWRSAPLGCAGPRLVAATYHSFSPRMVAEHVPAVWTVASAEKVLATRLRAVDRAFRTLLGDDVEGPAIAEAARIARAAAEAADTAGRPLGAANADLAWPEAPHLQLWQAATILREHRGDGHVAALVTAGLDPCEALVSFAALGVVPVDVFASRGWTNEEWGAAQDRLTSRGWMDADGNATERGRQARQGLEVRTDELAAGPWAAIGADEAGRLAGLVMPLMRTVVGSGMLPRQSTLGLGTSA